MKLSEIVLAIWATPFVLLALFLIYAFVFIYLREEIPKWNSRRKSPYQPQGLKRFRRWWRGIDWGYVLWCSFAFLWIFGLLGLGAYLESRGL